MIVTERERIELVTKLEEAMGQKAAATLMEYLPASGWRDVATVTDLDNVRLSFKADLADVRTELKTEFADLRIELKTEMGELRTELKHEMGELRTELKDEIGELRKDMTGLREGIAAMSVGLHRDMSRLSLRLSLALIGAITTFGGLVIAAGIFKP